MYRRFGKRLFDLILSFLGLVGLAPVILVLMVLLYIVNRGSPFFFQDRPGQNAERIRIIKFKSMNDKKDSHGKLLPDKERMTVVGSFIRKTSLDELPQLFNVLKGDMSLIGPRPLLFKYLPLYSEEQRRRHDVKPGITGLAQVSGRNAISWQKKFKYDVWYVDHLSPRLDVHIFLKTIKKVLIKEGVDQSKERPMEPFNGSN